MNELRRQTERNTPVSAQSVRKLMLLGPKKGRLSDRLSAMPKLYSMEKIKRTPK